MFLLYDAASPTHTSNL